jgi:hypothetical protein
MLKIICAIAVAAAEPTLKYVFEVVRHGARAPLIDDGDRFQVSKMGMLTPQGMRQRYLLGKYNYHAYGEKLGGPDLFKPNGGFYM